MLILETTRLLLKPPQYADFDAILSLRTDPDVMQYTSQGRIQTKEEVQQFLDTAIPYYEKHGFTFFSVFEKKQVIL